MQFTQHVVIQVADEAAIVEFVKEASEAAAEEGGSGGFLGGRLLRFRDKPGRYVIQADFASWEGAQASNEDEQTQEWAQRLTAIIDGDPKYEDLDVLAEF